MSLEPILALIVVAVIANLVVMGILVASPGVRRDDPFDDRPAERRSEPNLAAAAVVGGTGEEPRDPSARAYDRVTGQDDGIDDALGERGHRRRWEPEMGGATWDTDSRAEIERRLPRLSRLFPRHRSPNT